MRNAIRVRFLLPMIATCGFVQLAVGQEESVRYYEQGGVTYREVKTKVQRPVREVEYKEQQQTLYREKYDTQMQSVRQYRQAPVRQYYWEPKVHGQWNLISGPHVAYHLRQRTTMQTQTRIAQVPITQRRVEPETRTVKVPVPKLSMKDQEVVHRVAVGPAAGKRRVATGSQTAPTAIAWNIAPRPTYNYGYAQAPVYIPAYPQVAQTYTTPGWNYGAYGGVARLEGDPPRYGYGYSAGNAGAWQARRNTNESR